LWETNIGLQVLCDLGFRTLLRANIDEQETWGGLAETETELVELVDRAGTTTRKRVAKVILTEVNRDPKRNSTINIHVVKLRKIFRDALGKLLSGLATSVLTL
jgi:hypothetical protein